MKLIKINTDHYIIVDDSEIKEGDWILYKNSYVATVLGFPNDGGGGLKIEIVGDNAKIKTDFSTCKKITQSTQPFELLSENGLSGMGFSKVRPLNIFEVKELLGEVDVEKKAEKWFESQGHNIYNHYNTMPSYVSGYNQALEDNKEKKYTEKDIDKAYWAGMQFVGEDKGSFGEFIQSLQPKTEWEVEMVDGKLKLM